MILSGLIKKKLDFLQTLALSDENLLLEDLLELAGNVSGVTVHDWCITVLDFTRVVEDDDLNK